MIGFPIFPVTRVVFRVHDLEILVRADRQARPFGPHLDHLGATDQDRLVGGFFQHGVGGAQHAFILALGKDDVAGSKGRGLEHRAHDQRRAEDRAVKLALIGVQILDRPRRHARFHRRLGNSGRHHTDQARIEGLRDQVIRPEGQLFTVIGGGGFGCGGGAGKRRDAFDTGQLHLVIDLRGPHIQRAPEDEGETQHVVDLIGKIAAPGGDHRIGGDFQHLLGHDLGRGVRQRENHRAVGHLGDHFLFQHTGPGQAKEQIRPVDHLIQRAQVAFLRIGRLLRVHILGPAFIDQPMKIAEPHIFAFHAQLQQHVQAGDARRAAAGRDDLDVFKCLADHTQRIGGGGPHDNGGAVLVVVEDGDVHLLAAQFFHDEAFGRLDVFQVDGAKARFQTLDDGGQLFGVGFGDFQVETVDIGEFLEQNRLAFHHRL